MRIGGPRFMVAPAPPVPLDEIVALSALRSASNQREAA